MQKNVNDILDILKLAGLKEEAMMQVVPPGTPKPPAMQPTLTLPQSQPQATSTALGGSTQAVPGSNVKQSGTMEEELHGDQDKLDIDDDGRIEGTDLAALRAGKVDERYVLGTSPSEFQASRAHMSQQASQQASQQVQNNQQFQSDLNRVKSSLYMQPGDSNIYSQERGLGPSMASQRLQKSGVDIPGLVGNRANPATMDAGPGVPDTNVSASEVKEDEVEEGNYFGNQVRLAKAKGLKKADLDGDGDMEKVRESEQISECGEMGPMANGMDNNEGKMNISTNMSSDGNKSVTVTADGDAAVQLMQLLSLAGMKTTQPEVEQMYEAKDSRYEASTTPEEKVLPLETQLKGGTGEVAGKTKKMVKDGAARFSDSPIAVKESVSLSFLKEYESLLLKKKINESDSPQVQDRFGLELGDFLIEMNIVNLTQDGFVLEADEYAYNYLNKLGYLDKEKINEAEIITEGPTKVVEIEDSETGDLIEVEIEYETYDGELDFVNTKVLNNPTKQLNQSELDQAEKELISLLKSRAERDYDDYDRNDYQNSREKEYYSKFPMHYAGLKDTLEAKYQGREVPLGKPMQGDVKKSKVYVKGPKGNVVKVNFGDPNMRIKKSNPKRRKSFRARHNCANPGPRWKARYWSCRAW